MSFSAYLNVGGHRFRIEPLASEWERYEVVALSQTSPMQAAAVILGRCLPELDLGKDWILTRGNPVLFAPKVGDALLGRGINPAEILAAGTELLQQHAHSLLPSDDELAEVRGNETPPPVVPTA